MHKHAVHEVLDTVVESDDETNVLIQIRAPLRLRKAIRVVAAGREVSMSELIRRLLEELVSGEGRAGDDNYTKPG